MKKLLLTITCFLFSAANAQNGIYLGAEGGTATQSGFPSPNSPYVNANNMENQHGLNAFRFSVGYNHDLARWFGLGLDIGAGQYGKTTYNYPNGATTVIKSTTLEFLAQGILHIKQVDVIGKLGGIRITPKLTGPGGAPSSDTQIRAEAAIGAAYNFTKHFAATLTYSHVFGDQISTLWDIGGQAPSVNEALLGLRYSFGS